MQSGTATFIPRARLMILLGEQLITDEATAVSELIKNSYDADATEVIVKINDVTLGKSGTIEIIDNGNGMTTNTVIESWFELGTLSKARIDNQSIRKSERMKRPYLGEKGIGRLSVHKLGNKTELITRRIGSQVETTVDIDWSAFEDPKKFLKEIDINWKEQKPLVFSGSEINHFEHGTKLILKDLHRKWTAEMLEKIKTFVWTMQSPLTKLENFNVHLKMNDPREPTMPFTDFEGLVKSSHYTFSAGVDSEGIANMSYVSNLPLYPDISRKKKLKRENIKLPESFAESRKPTCGPFNFMVYCWDLSTEDLRATFHDRQVYESLIRPQTGIKLFRDGFRVLPYGNEDNDWLNLDKKRIQRFEENVSRNQVMGIVEITSKGNPLLFDKSDREGLIDNQAFSDFKSLVLEAFKIFENERATDRDEIKSRKKKKRNKEMYAALSMERKELRQIMLDNKIPVQVQKRVEIILDKSSKLLDEQIRQTEEPLLVAASIGLSYMIPTHEIKRNILESKKIAKKLSENTEDLLSNFTSILRSLTECEEAISGIARLSQKVDDEIFDIAKAADSALALMKQKLNRNAILVERDYRTAIKIKGSERLFTITLLNLIDNSIYWLGSKAQKDRKIKLIIDVFNKNGIFVLSDNGSGLHDPLDMLVRPFITRKPKGMGLGLYICERVADLHKAKLNVLYQGDLPGLLEGANIAITFSEAKVN